MDFRDTLLRLALMAHNITINLEFEMGVALLILASLFAWLIYQMASISVAQNHVVSFFGYAVYILLSMLTLLIKEPGVEFMFILILTCGFGLFLVINIRGDKC